MARRQDHTREELSKLIFETTWDMISHVGLEKITARSLAKKIGYAPGTIYNLYPSMDALFRAINAKTLDLLYTRLSNPECSNPHNNLKDNIKIMAACYLQFSKEYNPYWLMLFEMPPPEEDQRSEIYLQKIAQLFEPMEILLRQHGIKDYQLAARTIWASLHGICMLEQKDKLVLSGGMSAKQMIDYLVNQHEFN